ncbi:hypothetical protein ACROYT_G017764 [Oculina patagonica]
MDIWKLSPEKSTTYQERGKSIELTKMENMPNKETVNFDPETGKITPIATDKTVALKMAADGFFSVTGGERVLGCVVFSVAEQANYCFM